MSLSEDDHVARGNKPDHPDIKNRKMYLKPGQVTFVTFNPVLNRTEGQRPATKTITLVTKSPKELAKTWQHSISLFRKPSQDSWLGENAFYVNSPRSRANFIHDQFVKIFEEYNLPLKINDRELLISLALDAHEDPEPLAYELQLLLAKAGYETEVKWVEDEEE
jgi:hypothetical protein